MVFVFGPLFSGKREYIKNVLGYSEEYFAFCPEEAGPVLVNAQELAPNCPDLEALCEALCAREVVSAAETGCGVVPADPAERAAREASGRLCVLLAARAEKVIRVWCGLPEVLKG